MREQGSQAVPADSTRKTRVAIVGTGLAGLATAYLLHNDSQKRYEVTLFEQANKLSLDAASVTVKNDETGITDRIDVPLRSFCKGYYHNLCRMYNHLNIPFQRIHYTWVFAKASATPDSDIPEPEDAETMPGAYFVYGQKLHEMLLLSPQFWRSSLHTIMRTLHVALCHIWFTIACLLLQPRMFQPEPHLDASAAVKGLKTCESLRQYLQRIRLPENYVYYYLLPVLSVICSCSHAEMMDFPASDVTGFVRGNLMQWTYVAQGGVDRVQSALSQGINDVRLQTRVTRVEQVDDGISIRFERLSEGGRSASSEVFDRVVLAVSPNVVAAVFNPSKPTLSVVPTVPVTSAILASSSARVSLVGVQGQVPAGESLPSCEDAQLMIIRTIFADNSSVQSETFHYLPSGVVVRSTPFDCAADSEGVHSVSRFTRTLRTTESRMMIQQVMGADKVVHGKKTEGASSSEAVWVNGMHNVWIAGSWCWDGMVLLEGCVVSAMRVAQDFGVQVPW